MSGTLLKAQVHVVTGESACIRHTVESCRMANLEVMDIVVKPLASAEAVLSAEDKQRGVEDDTKYDIPTFLRKNLD